MNDLVLQETIKAAERHIKNKKIFKKEIKVSIDIKGRIHDEESGALLGHIFIALDRENFVYRCRKGMTDKQRKKYLNFEM